MSSPERRALTVGALIIALGLWPEQGQGPAEWRWDPLLRALPVLPLGLIVLSVFMTLPRWIGLVCAIAVTLVGAVLSLASAALSGAGANVALLHGAVLTLAIAASVLLISNAGTGLRRFSRAVFAIPVAAAFWSLITIPVAALQAQQRAGPDPFCIGAHGPLPEPLTSLSGLRGFSFYTTRTGYKIHNSWYFHGILLIDRGALREVYTWSPRAMRFDRLEDPGRMIATPRKACQPERNFLTSLRWVG